MWEEGADPYSLPRIFVGTRIVMEYWQKAIALNILGCSGNLGKSNCASTMTKEGYN